MEIRFKDAAHVRDFANGLIQHVDSLEPVFLGDTRYILATSADGLYYLAALPPANIRVKPVNEDASCITPTPFEA